MKKIVYVIAAVAAGYIGWGQHQGSDRFTPQSPAYTESSLAPTTAAVPQALGQQHSNTQVTGEGIVQKVLPDDNQGSRHQRFILALPSGQTVLVAHNIDLAPRIAGLQVGDTVAFNGEYEWNPKGGVVHWTHHDPAGRHPDGWLRHAGRTFQ